MKHVTLEELKAQMRVEFDGEDHLIEMYGDAAEDMVSRSTRRTDEELLQIGHEEKGGDEADEVTESDYPSRLKVAILLIAAHFYRNREPVAGIAQYAVPYTYEALVKPYRKLGKG